MKQQERNKQNNYANKTDENSFEKVLQSSEAKKMGHDRRQEYDDDDDSEDDDDDDDDKYYTPPPRDDCVSSSKKRKLSAKPRKQINNYKIADVKTSKKNEHFTDL